MIFFDLIASSASTSNTAVNPFMQAYIGGRNDNGVAFGILTVKRIATTTGIATETILIQILYLFFLVINFYLSLMFSSSSCLGSILDGESIIISLPELFLGKAIKSRILSSPPSIAHNLSKPKATPP